MTIMMKKKVEKIFSDFFSSIAPNLYRVVDYHCRRQTGMSFAEVCLKNPKLAYDFLVKFFGSPITVDILDYLFGNYLRRYGISAHGVLKSFKNATNKRLLEVAEIYWVKKYGNG